MQSSSDKLQLQSTFPSFHVLKSLFSHLPDFCPLNEEICSASSHTDEAQSVLLPVANREPLCISLLALPGDCGWVDLAVQVLEP